MTVYETGWERRFAWFPVRIGPPFKGWIWWRWYEQQRVGYYGADWGHRNRMIASR